jgi:hypothetical protein
MPHKFIPEPWNAFFAEIDKSLDEEMSLHCLGGFVMTILYGLDRPTADVDVLPTGSNSAMNLLIRFAGEGSRLHNRHKVYLQVVGVAAVPLNYEERMTEMFPGTFKHLRLFALDPYDLALSKLERNTQRDRDDVKHLARTVPFDLAVLRERYQSELRPDLGNPQREDLTLRLWTEAIEEEAQ